MRKYVSIMADIHGNLSAMKEVYRDIIDGRSNRFMGYDGLYLGNIFAGDLIDYGTESDECLDYLYNLGFFKNSSGVIIGTIGNHDKAILDTDYSRFRTNHGRESAKWSYNHLSKYIRSSLTQDFNSKYKDILVCHGNDVDLWKNIFPDNTKDMDDMISRNPDVSVFIVAHSHLQFSVEYRGKLFINPGSIGQSRNGVPKAHYALLDLDTKKVSLRSVSYNIKDTADKIKNAGLDIFLAQRLFLGI